MWRWFYTLYEQKCLHLRPLLFITFPQGFRKSKKLDIGLWEVGAKRPLNGVRNTDTKKNLISKAKFAQKQIFLLRGNFTPYIGSFPIWDHFFPLLFPKNSKSLKDLDTWLQEGGGKKMFKLYLKSEQTHRQTHTHTHIWTNQPIGSLGPEGRYFENIYLFDKSGLGQKGGGIKPLSLFLWIKCCFF